MAIEFINNVPFTDISEEVFTSTEAEDYLAYLAGIPTEADYDEDNALAIDAIMDELAEEEV